MPLIAVFATFPYTSSRINSVFQASEKTHANTKHELHTQLLIVFHTRSLMFLLGRGGRAVSSTSTAIWARLFVHFSYFKLVFKLLFWLLCILQQSFVDAFCFIYFFSSLLNMVSQFILYYYRKPKSLQFYT